MKILIYMPFSAWYPHFATDLEIAKKHIDNDDEVHIIQCSDDLISCEPNRDHSKSICILCKSMRDKGLKLIGMPKQNRHELCLKKFIKPLDLPDFSSIQELKVFKIDNVDFGMAVAATLIDILRDPCPDLGQCKDFIKKNLIMSKAIYDAIKYYLEQIKPDVFYIYNGRFAAMRPALRAAQNIGIKTFVHERAGILQKYSLSEDTYPHDLEYQKKQIDIYWNEKKSDTEKYEIARRWFEERRNRIEQVWYSFTKSQVRGALPKGFDASKRNIAIFSISEDEFEAIAWERGIYKDECDMLNSILNANIEKDIRFYLRIHPNLKDLNNSQTRKLREISEKKTPNLIVIPAESEVDSYGLMAACEKVITYGSTMGIESVFYGKPSILVGHAFYEDLDACYIPLNNNDLIDLINSHLNPKPVLGALKYGYWQEAWGQLYESYVPESLFRGKFLDTYLDPTITAQRITKIIDKISQIKDRLKSKLYYKNV